MYKELNQHKKSDAVKWVVVFVLLIVLIQALHHLLQSVSAICQKILGKKNP